LSNAVNVSAVSVNCEIECRNFPLVPENNLHFQRNIIAEGRPVRNKTVVRSTPEVIQKWVINKKPRETEPLADEFFRTPDADVFQGAPLR
jgi:hypothetical protein